MHYYCSYSSTILKLHISRAGRQASCCIGVILACLPTYYYGDFLFYIIRMLHLINKHGETKMLPQGTNTVSRLVSCHVSFFFYKLPQVSFSTSFLHLPRELQRGADLKKDETKAPKMTALVINQWIIPQVSWYCLNLNIS